MPKTRMKEIEAEFIQENCAELNKIVKELGFDKPNPFGILKEYKPSKIKVLFG